MLKHLVSTIYLLNIKNIKNIFSVKIKSKFAEEKYKKLKKLMWAPGFGQVATKLWALGRQYLPTGKV